MKRIYLLLFTIIHIVSCAQGIQNIIPKIKDAVLTIYAEDENGEVISSGSGFFISSLGEGITNFHVLNGAFGGKVKDANGKYYEIKHIIDYNPQYDLIKFKVNNQNPTKFLQLSSTPPLQGEQIISYSTPLGVFENTVSTGIVASIRKMVGYESVLQITAPISHGSSGSPVLNTKGQVVGVATFGCEEGQSLNFAVNVSQIRKLTKMQNIKIADMVQSPLETQLVRKAFQYVKKQSYLMAVSNLDTEIANNPQNHLAYFLKGRIYTIMQNYGTALNNLSKACELDKNNYNYKIEFARTLRRAIILYYENTHSLNDKLMSDVINAYSDAIQIDRERYYAYAELSYVLAFAAIRMKPINTEVLTCAKDYADVAIELGHDPDNYVTRAHINTALGNNGQAILDCDEAIKYNPNYFRPYLQRADIKIFNIGNIDDGLIDAERALALAQTNKEKGDVYGIMGMAYEEKAFKLLNRESVFLISKAMDCYDMAYNLDPTLTNKQLNKDLKERLDKYMHEHGTFP